MAWTLTSLQDVPNLAEQGMVEQVMAPPGDAWRLTSDGRAYVAMGLEVARQRISGSGVVGDGSEDTR